MFALVLVLIFGGSPAHGSRDIKAEISVLELPKEAIHNDPLVKDANIAGNAVPPRTALLPLNATELQMPHTAQYVAMCLVSSETGEEVREWLDHYLRLGVDKFYVFDHNAVAIMPAFADLVELGIVEYQAVPVSLKCVGWEDRGGGGGLGEGGVQSPRGLGR